MFIAAFWENRFLHAKTSTTASYGTVGQPIEGCEHWKNLLRFLPLSEVRRLGAPAVDFFPVWGTFTSSKSEGFCSRTSSSESPWAASSIDVCRKFCCSSWLASPTFCGWCTSSSTGLFRSSAFVTGAKNTEGSKRKEKRPFARDINESLEGRYVPSQPEFCRERHVIFGFCPVRESLQRTALRDNVTFSTVRDGGQTDGFDALLLILSTGALTHPFSLVRHNKPATLSHFET